MIRVVGCGVSGLTCGVVLAEAGYEIEIVTSDHPASTVSAVAAALWYPLRSEFDPTSSVRWMAESYARFAALTDVGRSGVVMRDGVEIFRGGVPDTSWWPGPPVAVPATCFDLPAVEWERVPVIEMTAYLDYLAGRFERARGRIVSRTLESIDDAFDDAVGVVVNCSGLASAELCGDDWMYPVRGQIVRLEQRGIERFILDEQNPGGVTYVIPRAHDVVCGGTREPGKWLGAPDPDVEREIIDRCVALEPRLKGARVVSRAVGLRPGRPQVRLEAEERERGVVIHDYGHSGSGVTLSWGCAADVLDLARAASG